MNIILYNKSYTQPSIHSFLDALYSNNMPYLASDLLEKGLLVSDITQGIKKALMVMRRLSLDVDQHFKPFYSQHNDGLMKDCKLSKLGYALVLLNLNANNAYIANLQLTIADYFFNEHDMRNF
ncbi:hypothetical protein KFZ70_02775 [Tamlana fucoidanivorans]|uniref:Uncharacterized protein n=1 Tax=Allotamlana fucoidanivorans TaxID=2583814 RepID=A0A5C4SE84_9FLAO|nr:hypothetical protein [Tamlana fucoidanivorans]TNJ41905.1 hypothetical protein FGF67_15205 [Tamlana fucoidanivorans]